VALPKELYPYPAAKTVTVGIPLSHNYQRVTPVLQRQYRHELSIDQEAEVLLVTGGGNGADQLNNVVLANAEPLLKRYPKLVLLHITGRMLQNKVSKAYDTLLSADERTRVRVEGFITDLYRYSGAADVVIARAGATNLAEFAAQGKACIIVPASQLVGSHQVKNAKVMAERGAILTLDEQQSEQELRLAHLVSDLLDNSSKRTQLGEALAAYAHSNAAKDTADLILEVAAH